MKQSKIKVAVTGGIGSGKSTVCNILKSLGYAVYSCDEVYKQVLQDSLVLEELAKEFGNCVINKDGSLNRPALSAIVFNDAEKLEKLKKLTHSKIFEKMFEKSSKDSGVVFYEVPLLFEGGYQNLFDEVLVVLRDREQRIKSIIERDNLQEKEAINRLSKQIDYDKCDFAQYYVIHNNGNLSNLRDVINQYLSKFTTN